MRAVRKTPATPPRPVGDSGSRGFLIQWGYGMLDALDDLLELGNDRRARILRKILLRVEILPNGCWRWTGPTSGSKGRGKDYPRMSLDGSTVAVHRTMWALIHGPIPPKKQLDHSCRFRLCVRPDHLEIMTHLRNQRLRAEAARALLTAA